MPILRIKLTGAAGQALAGQTVKVSGAGSLQTNDLGIAQFLLEGGVPLEIDINDAVAWSGSSADLAREEHFQQGAGGFVRVAV